MVGPSAKRKVFSYLEEKYQASKRLISKTINLSRSTARRRVEKDDMVTEEKLDELAERYPTRGVDYYYGKIRQEGLQWNRKRVLRVYRKKKMQLRRKTKKRLNRPYTQGISQPLYPNVTWSMDFMSDAMSDGRKLRVLTIIDDFNRECLAIEIGLSISSERVIRIVSQLIEYHGKPDQIQTDNGPEFTSHGYTDWCLEQQIDALYIQPGKPNQNGLIERFNRTYREDVLDAYLFDTIAQADIVSQKWRQEYNHGHPHQSLGRMSPWEFKSTRRKGIEAYERVKAKMNDSLRSSALTISPPSMARR